MLTLPYPPSINHYWRNFRGRVVISREGRAFRKNVQALPPEETPPPEAPPETLPEGTADATPHSAPSTTTLAQRSGNGPRKPPAGGRIALCMDAFPPDRRRRDLDNIQKPVLDSLEHAGVYEDDSQIDLLLTRRCEVTKHGRVEIHLYEMPLRRCPLCHTPFAPENN